VVECRVEYIMAFGFLRKRENFANFNSSVNTVLSVNGKKSPPLPAPSAEYTCGNYMKKREMRKKNKEKMVRAWKSRNWNCGIFIYIFSANDTDLCVVTL
jgi:hypothetical protein